MIYTFHFRYNYNTCASLVGGQLQSYRRRLTLTVLVIIEQMVAKIIQPTHPLICILYGNHSNRWLDWYQKVTWDQGNTTP